MHVLFELQLEETLGQVETSFFSCVEPNTFIKYAAVTFESNCQKSNRIGRSFEEALDVASICSKTFKRGFYQFAKHNSV